MSCSHFEELIAWATSEALTPEEQARLDAHLEGCAACRRFAAELESSQDVLTSLGAVALPQGALAEVRERLHHEIEIQAASRRRVLGAAFLPWAALILMAVSVWWWLPGENRMPSEAPSRATTSPLPPPPPLDLGVESPETSPTAAEEAPDEIPAAATPAPVAAPEPGISAELPAPSPTSEIAAARPPGSPGDSSISPKVPNQATVDSSIQATAPVPDAPVPDAPEPGAPEPMVVQWISEDPDLVIYWLVDSQPEEETPNAISNPEPSEV